MREEKLAEVIEVEDKLDGIRERLKGKKPTLSLINPKALKLWDLGLREDNNQVEALAQDMREQGYRWEHPVIVDTSAGEVVAGAVRFFAALKAGIEQMPCVCYDTLNGEERIVVLSDDGLMKASKSPMAMIRHLQIMHEQFGFSYRDMERLMAISRSAIDRKLGVLKADKSIQDLYATGRLSDSQVQQIRKDVAIENQAFVAAEIVKIEGKPSGDDIRRILKAYQHALKEQAERIKAGERDAKLEIKVEKELESEAEKARETFKNTLDDNDHYLRTTDFTLSQEPVEELNRLLAHFETVRETIRQLCAKMGIEPRALSRHEEIEILSLRENPKKHHTSTAAPSLSIAFERAAPAPAYAMASPEDDAPELLAAYHEEHAPFDESGADLVTERTFQAMGVSPEEKDLLLNIDYPFGKPDEPFSCVPTKPNAPAPASPRSLDASQEPPIHYVDIAPKRFEKTYESVLKRSLGQLPDQHVIEGKDDLDNIELEDFETETIEFDDADEAA